MTSAKSEITQQQTDNAAIVRELFDRLVKGDIERAADLLDEDVEWENVSLPTVRGRERVGRALKLSTRLQNAGLEIYFHAISVEGETVLSERTDVLTFGPMRWQFWVCGRFDIRDGKIVLWRDYFDFVNVTLALIRGLVGIIVPAVRARPPVVS
jgi:limonene-1,2-epoxide hydrolase